MTVLQPRYRAIDVMRGLALALMIVVNMSISETQSFAPLLHARWNGLTLTDLVFPTFLFVVGTALSFTLEAYQRRGDAAVLRKIAIRSALIFLCGYLLSWFPFIEADASGHWAIATVAHTRILGVLQRIALGYGSAALIIHYGGRVAAAIYSVAALIGYWWLLQAFGDYSLAGNVVLKFDEFALGAAHLYHGEGVAFDPEGILSTLPAIVNVLAGFFAGRFVRDRGPNYESIAKLLLAASACIAIALAWDSVLPINKKLWTSSYVLCTVGFDLVLLALLVYVLHVRGQRRWARFFEVFGRNTLFIFLLSELGQKLLWLVQVGRESLFHWLYATGFQSWAGDKPGSLLYAVTFMLGCWLVAYALDRRRIYLKL